MGKGLAATLLRVYLACAIAYAPVLHAANESGGPPPLKTTGGGGGRIPPPPKPVKLGGGDSKDSGNGKSEPKEEVKTGAFGERWGIEHNGHQTELGPDPKLYEQLNGTEIYYEGTTDAQGRVRVWKHDLDSRGNTMVKRGVVNKVEGTDGVVDWRWTETWLNLWKERSGFSGFNRGDSDGKAGEIYGSDAGGREIEYEGWRDYAGRLRVRRYTTTNKFMFSRGYVEELPARMKGQHSKMYTVRWDKGYFRESGKFIFSSEASANLLEPVKVQVRETAKGEPVMRTVYYQGRRAADGSERIFRPDTFGTKVNNDWFRTGILKPDGTVEWDSEFMSRLDLVQQLSKIDLDKTQFTNQQKEQYRANLKLLKDAPSTMITAENFQRVIPNSNYPAMEGGAKDPIPRNRALVPYKEPDSTPKQNLEARTGNMPKHLNADISTTTGAYQESNLAKDVLPQSRSLILQPVEKPATDHSGRTGVSEGSSPSIESRSAPEWVEVSDADAPSELYKKFEWSVTKARKLKKTLDAWTDNLVDDAHNEFFRKDPNAEAPATPQNMQERGERFGQTKTAEMSMSGFYFYFALGLGAAYTLSADYSSNPIAWTAFKDSLTDPVGWAALAGFMVAAGPFYKIMNGPKNAGLLRQAPLFTASLLAGMFAATAVSKLGKDANVRACLGFVKFPFTGKFERDMPACDRAYHDWTSDQGLSSHLADIVSEYLPTAAGIVATGLAFLVGRSAATALIEKSGMLARPGVVKVLKGPAGPWISIGIGVTQMAIFLGAYEWIVENANIYSTIQQWQLLEFNINSNKILPLLFLIPGKQWYVMNRVRELIERTGPVKAETLHEAETQLFTEWARVKKNNWKNPNSWRKICYDEHRVVQKFYNCDEPDALDFEGTLDSFSYFQNKWRTAMIQPTIDKYKSWMAKANDYQGGIDTAYKFYSILIKRIAEGKKLKAEDLDLSGYGRPNGPGLDIWADRDFSGVWKYVDTPKQQDFWLTSMACGPEVEGYGGNDGFFGSVNQFYRNWVTWNYSPDKIIKDPAFEKDQLNIIERLLKGGRATQFMPPRVTTPLAGTKKTVCDQLGPWLPEVTDLLSVTRYSPLKVPLTGENRNYYNMVDYVSENIRANILSDGFEAWWSKYVTAATNQFDTFMRKDYANMLENTYKPALTRHDYTPTFCGPAEVKGTGLEKIYRQLPEGEGKCPADALHRQANGLLDSLHDEMRLYLAMLADLYIANAKNALGGPVPDREGNMQPGVNSASEYEDVIMTQAQGLLTQWDVMLKELSKTNPDKKAGVAAYKKAAASWKTLSDMIKAAPGADLAIARKNPEIVGTYQKRWALKLVDKMKTLFETYTVYYKILMPFTPEEAEQAE